jgi:hypothetical protein
VGHWDQALQPQAPLHGLTATPEPSELDGHRQCLISILSQTPLERSSHVAEFLAQPIHPLALLTTVKLSGRSVGQSREILEVTVPRSALRSGLLQPPVSVLAQSLQQAVTGPTGDARTGDDHRLVDQAAEDLEGAVSDLLARCRFKTAREHRQAGKSGAFVIVEQVMAPPDCRLERLMPWLSVTAPPA